MFGQKSGILANTVVFRVNRVVFGTAVFGAKSVVFGAYKCFLSIQWYVGKME